MANIQAGTLPYQDLFSSQMVGDNYLVNACRALAYTCSNLNANSVAAVPRKLFVKGNPNREVLTHPLLDILETPNKLMDGTRFLAVTQQYLEIVGRCYWRIINNAFGLPAELWILQPQFVTVQLSSKTGMPELFRYSNAGQSLELRPEQVIDLYSTSLVNPYVEGTSPLAAAMELVHNNYLVREHTMKLLENEAKPAAIVSPKADSVVTESMMQRFIKLFTKKYRRNSGGIAGITAPVDVTPIGWSARDSEFLEFYQQFQKDICAVFQIPTALLESSKSRAELEAALVQHGRLCLNPRTDYLDAVITKRLCKLYNQLLFVQSDDAAPEDHIAKATMLQGLVNSYIISPEEAREKLGYEGSGPKQPKQEIKSETQ
jgi:HK97 family phage portal protein